MVLFKRLNSFNNFTEKGDILLLNLLPENNKQYKVFRSFLLKLNLMFLILIPPMITP